MIDWAMPQEGKRSHPSPNGVVDGEHQRYVRWSSRSDTSWAARFSISTFAPSVYLRSHYSPSRFGKTKMADEQESYSSRIPGKEQLNAHALWETGDGWKQEWSRLFHYLNRKQDGVSSTPA